MDTGLTNGRGICRYYSTKGECYYGSDCQYSHQNPRSVDSSVTSSSSTSNTANTGAGLSHVPIPSESKLKRWMPDPVSSNGSLNPNANDQGISKGGRLQMSARSSHYSMVSSSSSSSYSGQNMARNNQVSHLHHSGQVPSDNRIKIPVPLPSFFLSEDIKSELLKKQALMQAIASDPYPLPSHVEQFQDLVIIEEAPGVQSSAFGGAHYSTVYKATNGKTGDVVCLRRIHSYTPSTTRGLGAVIDNWKKLSHANLVTVKHVFTTKDFGDISLVFVYEYFPGAQTLHAQYFMHSLNSNLSALNGIQPTNRPYSQQPTPKLLPEQLIWSYIIQLSSVIRVIHAQGMACRSLHPSKILLTSGLLKDPNYISIPQLQLQLRQQPRLRLSGCAVVDILGHETYKDERAKMMVVQYQQEDLLALGKLCLALACNSIQAVKQDRWKQSLEQISTHYSSDLRVLIVHLLSIQSGNTANINDIMPMIGARFYTQLEHSYQKYDILESELAKELENSRLFRLICKLGYITERPEHKSDPQWSETGDRYLVKLFRDYLFHQVTDQGRPWLDIGHIVSCLNKLDMGLPEKIRLTSRDGQNVLIVTYEELKKCFEASFSELLT